MSRAPGQGMPLTKPALFKDRISLPLVRILVLYVAPITVSVMALTGLAVYFHQTSEIEYRREQVLLRLVAEVNQQAGELGSLALSPSLPWAGQTDTRAPTTYLASWLERFHRGPLRQAFLLDARGVLIAPPGGRSGVGAAIAAEPAVRAAVSQLRDGYGQRTSERGTPQLLLIQRIVNSEVGPTVGFIVAVIDAFAVVKTIGVEIPSGLSLALGDLPLIPAPTDRWMYTSEGRAVAGSGDFSVPIHVWLGRSVYPSLLLIVAAFVLALVMGLWTIRRLRSWVEEFSTTTNQRLDRLLIECQKILAGERLEAVRPGPEDELSQVTAALNAMLVKQKQFTDELRTTALVFSMAAEGILVTDPQGRIVKANAALLTMTGYSRAELAGAHAGTLYRTLGDREIGRQMADALADPGRWSGETIVVGSDERLIPASVAISRILGEDGKVLGNVSVITDISRLKKVEDQLRNLANQDALTGLPNLRYMSERVQSVLEEARASSKLLALVFLDLDNFKGVNDSYGHDAGDLVVQTLASHLKKKLPVGHLLCRRSGDEFIALVERSAVDSENLDVLLHSLMPLEVSTDTGKLMISGTIGVSRFPEDATDWHELQVCADVAMNEAKQDRRGSLVWFDTRLSHRRLRHHQIRDRLLGAIKTNAFEVHYQPELDLRTGRVVGFEALARWHDAELGDVGPSEFVAVAEESRVMDDFTLCIADRVLHDKPMLQTRFPGAVVAFNACPQVFHRSRLFEFLAEWNLRDDKILEGLEIELTETEISQNDPALQLQLQVQALVGMGVRIVIDDFGMGYSSLSRLTQFPISRLKIDRVFVEGLGRARERRIARLVIELATVLGFEVTAEGVETLDQRDRLVRMGCHRGQGWLFAKAMPASELLKSENPINFPAA